MRQNGLIGIFFLFLCSFGISAQNADKVSPKSIRIDADIQVTFDRVIDYLQDNGYFIVSLDRQSGFIQSKIFVENKKLLSAKVGEKRTLNFIIRSVEENKSKITLSIYCEEQLFNTNSSSRVYYYQDKGISEDLTLYEEILKSLQNSF